MKIVIKLCIKEKILQPKIEILKEKKLVGNRIRMSFSDNKSIVLWRSFMPRRKEIRNNTGSDMYSVEIYPADFFNKYNPEMQFEKWAAVEVKDFTSIPDGMEFMELPGGLYAVFLYHGPASAVMQTYQYILQTWLPNSGFMVDNRPHYAVMGDKYKNEDSESEEEIAVPVKAIVKNT
jgi:AraC family transcriptional regulator